jgi:hypothetical protein
VLVTKVSRSDLIEIRNAILERFGPGAAFNFAASVTALFKWLWCKRGGRSAMLAR